MSTIYLLDDHPLVREGLTSLLEAAGHSVLGEASDAQDALKEISTLEPDILLLDLTLNTSSGLVVLIELQRMAALRTRTIVLTMSAQARHVAEARRSGASGYVLKGSTSHELLTAISVVHNGGSYLSPQIADFAVSLPESETPQTQAVETEDPWVTLSMRERQILELVVRGQTSIAIATFLHLSPKTVETYRSRLMTKLGVNNVTGLMRHALRHGLVDTDAL
jgi:DNA-binding NarL/FixJ family response regulator